MQIDIRSVIHKNGRTEDTIRAVSQTKIGEQDSPSNGSRFRCLTMRSPQPSPEPKDDRHTGQRPQTGESNTNRLPKQDVRRRTSK